MSKKSKSSRSHRDRRQVATRVGAVNALALAIGSLASVPAHAATTVALGNCDAAKPQVLWNAINASSAGDTLNITVDGTCVIDMANATDKYFTIAHVLTINGPTAAGSSLEIKSANVSNPLFDANVGLTLSNMTLTGHNSATSSLIYIPGAALTLSYVTLKDNNVGAAVDGAAISGAYPLAISHSTITNNTGGYGGAIWAEGNVTIDNSVFSENTASSVSNGHGGALRAEGNVTVTDSAFSNNDASTGNGGAISNSGTLDISDSTFDGNTASGDGAAIWSYQGGVTVERSTFSSNAADGIGGAITSFGAVSINNSTLYNNSGISDGLLYADSGAAITNSTLWNNYSTAGSFSVTNSGASVFGSIVGDSDSSVVQLASDVVDLGANLFTNIDGFTPNSAQHSQLVTPSQLDLQAIALNQNNPTNSGATQTIALGANSIARDYYTVTAPTAVSVVTNLQDLTDQRGVSRPVNGAYDVGAYEYSDGPSCTAASIGKVQFTADSPRLTKSTKKKLRTFGDAIASSGCTAVHLDGYTSTANGASKATEHLRTKLAKARNAAVKKYLTSYLAGKSVVVTFTTTTHNAHHPVASNAGKNRWKNRRVEISVVAPVG